MLFNSYEFILAFIPLTFIVYYVLIKLDKQRYVNLTLLLASIVFYGYSEKIVLFILILLIVINFIFGKVILHYHDRKKTQCISLWIGIVSNLSVLFYFKYVNFFIDSINALFNKELQILNIIQPLGISFIIFQQIAFLVDSYNGEIEECSFFEYFLFILYFPHVSSGPIILHSDLLPKLREKKSVDWDKIASGIYIFVMGLGKKVLIADMLSQAVNWAYTNITDLNSTSAVFISIVYSLQIYFDFSGYSDMAIGISRILLLDLPINFNSPYKAVTILDFWSRWHITLTRFFTKYLYIPLGGNRKGITRTCINTLIVFLLSGIWHGASWTFILWGALHGIFMIITKCFRRGFDRIPDFINRCITLIFVNFAWILFRSGSFTTFKDMMQAIMKFDWGTLNINITESFKPLIFIYFDYFNIAGWIWAVGTIIILCGFILKAKNVEEKAKELKYSPFSCVAAGMVAIMCLLSFSGVSSFIYSMF